jgi:hypothetical protein
MPAEQPAGSQTPRAALAPHDAAALDAGLLQVLPPVAVWLSRPTRHQGDAPVTVAGFLIHSSRALWAYRGVLWCSSRWSCCRVEAGCHPKKLRAACARRGSTRCQQMIAAFARGVPPPGGWPREPVDLVAFGWPCGTSTCGVPSVSAFRPECTVFGFVLLVLHRSALDELRSFPWRFLG